MELPLTTINLLGVHLPCSGGGYFRLLPYAMSRWALRGSISRKAAPASSTYTLGSSIPSNPGSSGSSPAFATTRTSIGCSTGCVCCSTSSGGIGSIGCSLQISLLWRCRGLPGGQPALAGSLPWRPVALSEVRVEALEDDATAAWDRFVQEAPEATFFHRAGWKAVVERSFGHHCHFLQAKRAGRITGVLPLVHVSSPCSAMR